MYYKVINKFSCCGKDMITVIINGKASCTMFEQDFYKIINTEKKYINKLRKAA